MRIDAVGGAPLVPSNPSGGPRVNAPAANQQSQQQQAIAAAALQQEEQKGGGGGGHGGHGAKKLSLSAIEDLAARASLRIEPRPKTVAERLDEIERLKAAQAAALEKTGEKTRDGDRDDGDGDAGSEDSDPGPRANCANDVRP